MTGFFLCDQPVLSLYAVGKITGTVVDLGHCKTGTFCPKICTFDCQAVLESESELKSVVKLELE